MGAHLARLDMDRASRGARLPVGTHLADVQPFRPNQGVRIIHTGNIEGYTDIYRFEDEFFMVASDTSVLGLQDSAYLVSEWVGMHFRLVGTTQVLGDDGIWVSRSDTSCHISGFSKNYHKRETVCREAGRIRYLSILVRPGFLQRSFADSLDGLPTAFRDYIKDPSAHTYHGVVPLSRDVRRSAQEIFETNKVRDIRFNYCRAKAMELLCDMLVLLPEYEAIAANDELHLRPLDREKLEQARRLIEGVPGSRLTISELSRKVGLNRRKLTYGFAKVFGVTVFDYGQGIRMKRAVEMLKEDRLNIGEIAFALGYDNPRNFSIAFKGYYGALPKDARVRLRLARSDESATAI